MAKEYQTDGQNRCRRCNKPLSDPNDNYGWWCAKLVGVNDDATSGALDYESLIGYNDSAYLQELDMVIKNAKDGWIDNKPIGVEFETGDLYYSIHKSTIYLNGYKREDGKWIINARMSDTYDFTELTSFMSNDNSWSWTVSKGTIANDVAVVSQKTGAIQPYRVTVDFWTVR